MTGVSTLDRPPQSVAPTRYTVGLARDEDDVRAAQRLRHDVFAGEMGALLAGPGARPRRGRLRRLLRPPARPRQRDRPGRRHLPAAAARSGPRSPDGCTPRASSTSRRSTRSGRGLVEVGRSCVHPDHRDGAVIGLIWAGIARYMVDRGHEWLAGCCSIPLADGGALAAGTWDRVRTKYLAPEEFRVRPLLPWEPAEGTPAARTELPPLLRGYLRLGAWVCGQPAHDPDFGVADLYVLLSMRRVNARYLRHFLSLAPA